MGGARTATESGRAVKLWAVMEVPSAASVHLKVGIMCGLAGPRAANQRVTPQQQQRGCQWTWRPKNQLEPRWSVAAAVHSPMAL